MSVQKRDCVKLSFLRQFGCASAAPSCDIVCHVQCNVIYIWRRVMRSETENIVVLGPGV